MIDATISRARLRDLARPVRSRPRSGTDDLVASIIWMGRAVVACAATAAAGWLAAGAAAAAPISVSLSVDSSTKQPGVQAHLVAKASRLPAGDRLVIQGTRAGQSKALRFAACSAPRCKGLWGEGKAGTVRFQALVVSAHGVAAHSRVVTVEWKSDTPPPPPPAPPPPPPSPGPAAGHYCGLTNEGKSICFDVGADSTLSNLVTESVVNCGDGSSWLWTLSFPGPDDVARPALTFSHPYSGSLPDISDSTSISVTYTVAGTFDLAGNASGTIVMSHMSWDSGGTHYECSGDPRTWKARLGA
jgi:hypothetical protein